MTRDAMIDLLVCCGTGLDRHDAEAVLDAEMAGSPIAQLLAWGVAVATAERAPAGEGMIAPVYNEGYNDRLDAIRAVQP